MRALFAGDRRTAAIPVVGGALDAAIATERVALIPSDCLVDRGDPRARARRRRATARPIAAARSTATAPASCSVRAPVLAALDGCRSRHAPPSRRLARRRACMPVPDAGAARAPPSADWCAELAAATADTDGPIARLDRAALDAPEPLSRAHAAAARTTSPTIGTAIGLPRRVGAGARHLPVRRCSARCSSGSR